ncbi:hypothetical protein QBC47DRAFT_203443 [Echria macrotheca]|uniref:Uncharacterized protein n=1 Tax=Echria macrotheca TaxID=438768 RepID=A0AAJ0BD66_9PEZI|nr:hypothetical protein QBC47DRAFT_203443 [Echria macrotheca]
MWVRLDGTARQSIVVVNLHHRNPSTAAKHRLSTRKKSRETCRRPRNHSPLNLPDRCRVDAPSSQQHEAHRQCDASLVLVCPDLWNGSSRRWPLLMLSSVVISVFAIVILSTLGFLYKANHPELVGGDEDPADGAKVAATVFTAVFIYAGFLVFCGLQGLLHIRESRRGAISL